MLARSTFTRITGIAVLIIAPMLVRAQVDSDPKLGLLSEATVMKSYRSPAVAYLLAVSGIVVPWVFAPSYYESWGEAFRFAALLSVAPSLGHIYAADYSEALLTTVVRFGGVVAMAAGILTGPVAPILGLGAFLGGVVWSLVTTGKSVHKYNAARAKTEIEPFVDLRNGGGGLRLTLRL